MEDFAKGDKVSIKIMHSKINPHCVGLFDGKVGIVRHVDSFGVCVIVDGGYQDAFSMFDLTHVNGKLKRALRRFMFVFKNI